MLQNIEVRAVKVPTYFGCPVRAFFQHIPNTWPIGQIDRMIFIYFFWGGEYFWRHFQHTFCHCACLVLDLHPFFLQKTKLFRHLKDISIWVWMMILAVKNLDSMRPYSVAVTGQTVTPIRNIFKIGLDKVFQGNRDTKPLKLNIINVPLLRDYNKMNILANYLL